MTDYLAAIQTLGFPIAACVWLAWEHDQMRKSLDNNTEAMHAVAVAIATCPIKVTGKRTF